MKDMQDLIKELDVELPTPECKPHPISARICKTHGQQMIACWQMSRGNLCSGCMEWHKKDQPCRRVN